MNKVNKTTLPLFLKDTVLITDILNNGFSTRFSIKKYVVISERQKHYRYITRGCIYDSFGNKNLLSERIGVIGGDHVTALNPEFSRPKTWFKNRKEGNSLLLGIWMSHYGHFITETLSRLWIYNEIDQYENLYIYPFIFGKGKTELKPYQAYFLGLLGIPSHKIKTLRNYTSFEKITIPEQGWIANGRVSSGIHSIYKKIREAHLSNNISYDRVFLSRRKSTYNRVINVSEVETIFELNNFSVIYPEELPIREQLIIYANCEVMAGFSGTALHNCVFSREETFVIEVADIRSESRMLPTQVAALELSGNEFAFIPYKENHCGEIDIKRLAEKLEECLKLSGDTSITG